MQLYKQPATSDVLHVFFTAPIPVRPSVPASRSASKKTSSDRAKFAAQKSFLFAVKPVDIAVFLVPKARHLSYPKHDSLLQKLAVPQTVKQFTALHENQKFMTVFTTSRLLSLSRVT
jgi:hypothetical protein